MKLRKRMKNKTRTKKKTRIERRWPPSPGAVRSGDSNSEGVQIIAGTLRQALTPHAGDVEVETVVRQSRGLA